MITKRPVARQDACEAQLSTPLATEVFSIADTTTPLPTRVDKDAERVHTRTHDVVSQSLPYFELIRTSKEAGAVLSPRLLTGSTYPHSLRHTVTRDTGRVLWSVAGGLGHGLRLLAVGVLRDFRPLVSTLSCPGQYISGAKMKALTLPMALSTQNDNAEGDSPRTV